MAPPDALVLAVRSCASLASCYMFASLLPEIRRVRAKRDARDMGLLPILSMLGNCVSWALYGLLLRDYFPLVATNAVGLGFACFYLVVYHQCTPAELRPTLHKHIGMTLSLLLALVLYALTATEESFEAVRDRVGVVSILVSFVMVGSPLVAVREVLRTKNTDVLPFALIAAATLNSTLWLSYGIILANAVVIAPNVVNISLGAFQLSLFVVFRKGKGYATLDKEKAVASGTASSQVRPTVLADEDEDDEEHEVELVTTRKAGDVGAL